jgi:hypothetical protein
MLFRSRADSFTLYGRSRRSRWRPPRWLVLLLFGMVSGAAGLWWVQERHLPPRLSAHESTRLIESQARAEAEATRLGAELAQVRSALSAAEQQLKVQAEELALQRSAVERLRGDLALVVPALPPDPRGGAVEVRGARFAAAGGALDYGVALTRDAPGRPLAATMKLLADGTTPQGPQTGVELAATDVSLGRQEVLRGSAPLPAGFKPQQVTVRVVDTRSGALLGARTLIVR